MDAIDYQMSLHGRSNWLQRADELSRDDANVLNVLGGAATERERAEGLEVVHLSSAIGRSALQSGALDEPSGRLAFALQSSARDEVRFIARVVTGSDGRFRAQGRLLFGDGEHHLELSTLGEGRVHDSPIPDHRHGTMILEVVGGGGLLADASGHVSISFTLDGSGRYADRHAGVLFLPRPEPRDERSSDGGLDEQVAHVRVADVIDEKAFPVSADATMEYVADLLALTEDSELMVIDEHGAFLGVVSEVTLLRAVIPDVAEILAAGGSIRDALALFLRSGRDLAGQPIRRLIKTNPRTVRPDDELLAVATVMIQTDTRRLPVVDRGRFVGSVSLADVCWAVLSKWNGIRHQDQGSP